MLNQSVSTITKERLIRWEFMRFNSVIRFQPRENDRSMGILIQSMCAVDAEQIPAKDIAMKDAKTRARHQ